MSISELSKVCGNSRVKFVSHFGDCGRVQLATKVKFRGPTLTHLSQECIFLLGRDCMLVLITSVMF